MTKPSQYPALFISNIISPLFSLYFILFFMLLHMYNNYSLIIQLIKTCMTCIWPDPNYLNDDNIFIYTLNIMMFF
jgi:hypothetical protein